MLSFPAQNLLVGSPVQSIIQLVFIYVHHLHSVPFNDDRLWSRPGSPNDHLPGLGGVTKQVVFDQFSVLLLLSTPGAAHICHVVCKLLYTFCTLAHVLKPMPFP